MRTLVNLFKRMGAPLLALLVLVVASSGAMAGGRISPAQRRANAEKAFAADLAEQAKLVREMNPRELLEAQGHFQGLPVRDISAFEFKAATTGTVVPGVLKLYNASSATSKYVLSFVIDTGRDLRTHFVQDVGITLPAGTVLELNLQKWGRYRIRAFADNDANGIRNAGDGIVAKDRFWILKNWWNTSGTRVRSMVFTGTGVPNPDPTPTYPNGSIVHINHLTGNKFQVRGSYNGSAYAFPNVPFESWSYVTGFYGNVATTAGFATVTNGPVTLTKGKTITGPTGANAPAAVWDVVDGDQTVTN